MPEVMFFTLLFLSIFSLVWTIIEIGIKWLVLQNVLVWKNVWLSLLNSVCIQLLQILGVALALVLSLQILGRWEKSATFSSESQNLLLFIVTFIFLKLVTDTTIGGLFLIVIKKNAEQAWRAAIISSFVGVFFLCAIGMLISSL